MEIFCLTGEQIDRIVGERFYTNPRETSLCELFEKLLYVAAEFVPVSSGSITLSDEHDQLTFVASFGEGSDLLPGTVLPPGAGVSGWVFKHNQPIIVNDPRSNRHFYDGIDRMINHTTDSLLCVPIMAGNSAIGVLSLLNRLDGDFEDSDMDLIKIFSGYLSLSIQTALEVRHKRRQLDTDDLSGLYNARYLYARLARELQIAEREKKGLGLLFLDLDHFKAVVDEHGHLIGSRAIAEVGQLLRACAPEKAVLARYGGDEYVAIFPDCDAEELLDHAECLRQAVKHAELIVTPDAEGRPPLFLKNSVTASVGAAHVPTNRLLGETVKARRHHFIRLADQAMYEAKARGKDQVVLAQQSPSSA